MERIKKNFGFGFMRLPMQDGEVDIAETNRMVDAFLDAGFICRARAKRRSRPA